MANKYLAREDAPISSALWSKIDSAMLEAAKSQLAGRRLLHVEGPFGIGLKTIPTEDQVVIASTKSTAEVVASGTTPVAMIRTTFLLSARDLASYERDAVVLDVQPVVEAAMACARMEDDLLFYGSPKVHAAGLLTVKGAQQLKLLSWDKAGGPSNDIIQAVTVLDNAGYHGPYTLALAPSRYNALLRWMPGHHRSELEHAKTIVTDGIIKAANLKDGGVLIASGRQYASIVLGQDMAVGFVGPSGNDLEFSISESLALHVRQPASICILEG